MKLSVKFVLDNQISYYNRSYVKIDSLIANTYAIYGFIIIVCQIIVGLIDINKVDFYIMNKLYTYEVETNSMNENNLDKFSDKNQVIKFENIMIHSNKLPSNSESEEKYSNKSHKVEPISNRNSNEIQKKKRKQEFKRKLCKLLTTTYLKCGKKSDFNKSMTVGVKYLEYDFNILTVMSKLIELEKIKDVLFTDKQKEMIKTIKNRVISADEKFIEELKDQDFSHEVEIIDIDKLNENNTEEIAKNINKRIFSLVKNKK